jgi:uncharacterized protein (TIGR02757 family)
MIQPPGDVHSFLEEQYLRFNNPSFIAADPISVPHHFTDRKDIEIAGFLTATIAWGNRKSIVGNARRLMQLMDNEPGEFLLRAKPGDLRPFLGFVHRTFNGEDCLFFITALQRIFRESGSLESLFAGFDERGAAAAIGRFRDRFLQTPHLTRSEKHLANPAAGSSAKRINMFLRWMVRRDGHGVDFGIWRTIDPANLVCPLDVHSGKAARGLGLLRRPQNDWRAAVELTENLRSIDPADPVKYDFALFGLSANGMDFF